MTTQFFNRDLSWIEFNRRVLFEGYRTDNPIMERLKFLTIVSSNFDEFFQVRVASLKRLLSREPGSTDISGKTNEQVLAEICQNSKEIINKQYSELKDSVLPELAKHGIVYVQPKNYTHQQESYTLNLFKQEIAPILTPLRAEDNVTHIAGSTVYAAFKLKMIPGIKTMPLTIASSKDAKNDDVIAIVQIPKNSQQIVFMPSESGNTAFALLEDIILNYGTRLFPGYTVEESLLFSVTRDADMGVDEDSGEQFIEAMEEVIANRNYSFAVRMLCTGTSPEILEYLKEKLCLSEQDVCIVNGPLKMENLAELAILDTTKEMSFVPWKNFNIKTRGSSIWNNIKRNDRLLYVPYESFEPITKFVSDAADDPKVLSIKMTLYRTEKNSEIIKALIRAARNGKQVTAFVELKARFDEQRNIGWATQLEKAGVIVIYGVVNLKVHAKALLVIRREEDGIKRYVHLSTGNYNAKTAKMYSDFSLFTADNDIANDITFFFNLLSGYTALQTMNHVFMAPVTLKSRILEMINREAQRSTPENPGLIIAKMNSLGHEEIISALYKASQAGVKILLNVRGICQLVPGVEGMSENIKVVSIVGRYLEHSRIFYFKNGGNEELYMSSADWMPRNLDRRIELMFPIKNRKCFEQAKKTLCSFFEDENNSHTLEQNGKWTPPQKTNGRSIQTELYESFQQQHEQQKKHTSTDFEVRRKG